MLYRYTVDSYLPAETVKLGRRWKLSIWVTLITQTRGFWNAVIFHVWWQKVPVILYCYQGAITLWIHQCNNSQAPCPWNILSTGHSSLLRSPIYVREVDVIVERPELVAIRNLPGCLMLPWMIPELNSLLIFPCPILDKISRTSWLSLSTPPPSWTSKIVTGLLPGKPLILHTWSKAGQDLTHWMVRFAVHPWGLQFCAFRKCH